MIIKKLLFFSFFFLTFVENKYFAILKNDVAAKKVMN